MCVCACVSVHVCVRAHVRVCVCVCVIEFSLAKNKQLLIAVWWLAKLPGCDQFKQPCKH